MKIPVGDYARMRFYNIYYLCKQHVRAIDNLANTSKGSSPRAVYTLENWPTYKNGLLIIRQIPFLKDKIDDLLETVPVYAREKNKPELDEVTYYRILEKKDDIVGEMETIIALYESMELPENHVGIDVKIPECDSLETYISYLKELDFILGQCPYLQHADAEIKFNTVDVGSQWINFLLKTTGIAGAASYILGNLALLVDKAIQIKSHMVNIEQQKEVLKLQKNKNELLDEELEIFRILKKGYIDIAVREMEEENKETPLKDGEERGRVEKSLEKLSSLLDKGVGIYASIGTDQEIQVLFPPLEDTITLPGQEMKYLESKEE